MDGYVTEKSAGSSRFEHALGRVDTHDHLCLIYESQEEQLAAAIPFIRKGLERGDKCLYIADDNTVETVLAAMRTDGLDVQATMASGALTIATKQDAYLRHGYFDPGEMIDFLRETTEQAKAEGYRAFRVTGEMTWMLGGDPGSDRLIEYESKLNWFFPQHDCLAICQYNRHRFQPETLLDVLRTHPTVVFNKTVARNFYYIPPDEFLKPRDPNAELERMLDSILDRDRAEDALKAAGTYNRNLIEASLDPLVTIAPDGSITDVNRATELVTGLPRVRIIGTDFSSYFTEPERARAGYRHVLESGEVRDYALEIKHPDGQVTPVLYNASVYRDDSGKIAGVFAAARDITDRKQAEGAMRRLAAIVESADDGILSKAPDGTILTWNRGAERIYGYRADEMIGTSISRLIPEERHEELARLLTSIRQRRTITNQETIRLRKDGKPIEVSLTVSPLTNEHGHVVGASTIARDITESKRIERERQELLAALQERVKELSLLYEAAKVFHHGETSEQEVLDRLVGLLPSGWRYPDITAARITLDGQVFSTPAFRETPWMQRAAFRTAYGMDGTIDVVYLQEKPDVEEGPFLKEERRILNTIAETLSLHLGQRHARISLWKSEERYRSLVLATAQIVWTTNAEGEVTDDIPQWRAYTGQGEDEIKGRGWIQALHPDDALETARIWAQAVRSQSLYDTEFRIQRHDGVYRHFAVRGVPVKDPDGRVREWVGTCTDITDRKQAEDDLRKLNEQLEQRVADRTEQLEAAKEELEAFNYSVSHDLRAPLRSIDGFSQALLEDCHDQLDEAGRDYLQRVRSSTEHMTQLIEDLLKLSRLSRQELNHEVVDLTEMARSVIEELQERELDRQVTIQITEGLITQGDPGLLRVVLENLIGNAWKFTSKQPDPRIEVGGFPKERKGQPIFFVRDNGAGFDMAYATKLFGAFQRLHGPSEYPGSGIGLATVRRIINRHGGKVWAKGEVGKGATFYFSV